MQALCAAHAQLAPLLADLSGMQLSQLGSAAGLEACVWLGLDLVVPFAPPLLVEPQLVAAFALGLRHAWEVGCTVPGVQDSGQVCLPFPCNLLAS